MSPNGFNSQEKRSEFIKELDEKFLPYRDIIENFATKHNLMIEKYYHDYPDWSLRFRGNGGICGSIDISFRIKENNGFNLFLVLWKDDFKKTIRKLKRIKFKTFNTVQPKAELQDELENIVNKIRELDLEDLDETVKCDNWKKVYKSEKTFLESNPQYPIIKI